MMSTDLESREAFAPIGSEQPQEPRQAERPDKTDAGHGIGSHGEAGQPGVVERGGQRRDTAATRAGAGELASTSSCGCWPFHEPYCDEMTGPVTQ